LKIFVNRQKISTDRIWLAGRQCELPVCFGRIILFDLTILALDGASAT